MDEAKFLTLCVQGFQMFRSIVPIDTGNMRYNATQFDSLGRRRCEIVVNGDIAPYAVYTNEPWVSPYWNGKKNPNEGWVEGGAELIAMHIAQQLGGRVVKG